MATYRLSVYVAKRSEGRSATSMAAYRACEVVPDNRTGQQFDYTRKSGLLYSEIVAPENAPDWARDRSELWNRSEAAHKRGDAVIAREIQLSLPHELTNQQRSEVSREFASHLAERYGVAVDMNLHSPHRDGDARNYHAHLMLCTRIFDENKATGLGNNVRAFDAISHQKASTENHVLQWRETWEQMLNNALERANVRDSDGAQVVVDHRSYKAREIDQEPQIKVGAAVTAKERRGEVTDRGQVNEEIKARNAAKLDAEELRRRQAQQITERGAREMGLKEQPEAPDPTQRRAQNIAAPQAARELTAANDNTPTEAKPARPLQLNRYPSESDEQYQARLERARKRIERAKEAPKLELKPKGPSFGY